MSNTFNPPCLDHFIDEVTIVGIESAPVVFTQEQCKGGGGVLS